MARRPASTLGRVRNTATCWLIWTQRGQRYGLYGSIRRSPPPQPAHSNINEPDQRAEKLTTPDQRSLHLTKRHLSGYLEKLCASK